MKMKNLIFVSLLVFLAFAGCSSNPSPGEPGAVITVMDRSVLEADVTQSFQNLQGDTVSVDILRDNILAREMFITHAIQLGLENDKEVLRLTHERQRELLQTRLMAYVLDQVESDNEAALEFWSTLGTGVSYTALALRDSLLMDSISTLVHGGADLSPLAVQFGLDHVTISTAGKIVIDDRNYANTMDVDHLAGALAPGQVFGPFPAPIGYRILQIDSVWTYDSGPFSADSQRIASILLARERESRKQFMEDSLKTTAGVAANPAAISVMAENSVDGFTFGEFTPEEDAITAVSWDGGSRDIYSVSRNIMNLPAYLPRETASEEWLSEYAVRLALFDLEMSYAMDLGLDTVPETARELRIKAMEVLLDAYYERIIASRAVPDSAYLQQVYLDVREDFPVEESRTFNVLYLADREQVDAAASLMEIGSDLLEMRDQFEVFPPILEEGSEYLTVPLMHGMVPETDREVLFGLQQGEETIVSLNDSTALWFRLVSVIPEHTPEYHEIAGRVASIGEQRAESEAIIGLVDSLKAVYHPYVNEEYFRGFYTPVEADSVSAAEDSEEVTDAL